MFNKIWRFSPEEGTETILAFNIVFTSFLFGDIVPGMGTETIRYPLALIHSNNFEI